MVSLCCLCFLPMLSIPRDGLTFAPLSLVAFLIYHISLIKTGIIGKEEVKAAVKTIVPGL